MASKHQTGPKHSVHMRIDFDTFDVIRSYASSQGKSVAKVTNEILGSAARIIKNQRQSNKCYIAREE